MKRSFVIASFSALGLLMASVAQATVVVQHTGSNDPTTEGFTGIGAGLAFAGPDAGPPTNWNMPIPTGIAGASGYYSDLAITNAAFTDPTGYTVTFVAKITQIVNPIATAMATVRVREGGTYIYDINMTVNAGVGNVRIGTGTRNWGVGDPSAAFHTYQLYFNPNGAGTADDMISLYTDGAFVSSLAALSGQGVTVNPAGPVFAFGYLTTSAQQGAATEQWATVRLETGMNIVPEPSAMVLMGFGLVGVVGLVWKRRRR